MSKPIIPWIGGKRRLAKQILPLFPDHQCYVEPFCGAAALFFMKDQVKAEVVNDINGELINLYRVVKHHPEALLQEFRWSLYSRQQFDREKEQPTDQLTDIQRAARFFYLQKASFGARIENQSFGTATTAPARLNHMRLEEDLSQAHLRLSAATIEHLPWEVCIDRYDRPHTLFYCDPPYWGTEGYGVGFGLDQYVIMASKAKTISGKMVISVNDIPEMRAAFDGLNIRTADIRYTVGGAKNTKAVSKELIISNY